jgi:hypothetical protein
MNILKKARKGRKRARKWYKKAEEFSNFVLSKEFRNIVLYGVPNRYGHLVRMYQNAG